MADMRLTDEEKKLLEGLTPFNANSTIPYTPGAYSNLPEKMRPIFTVRPLKREENDKLRRTLSNVKTADESFLREMVRILIVGMDQMYDAATGEQILYEAAPDGGMARELYATLPIHITSDILMYVSRISGLIPPEKTALTS